MTTPNDAPEDYQAKLDAWKARHGIRPDDGPDEMRMAVETKQSQGQSWCTFCDCHLPVKDMRLITLRTDAYRQIFDGEGDYIPESDRVYACPPCFQENYENI
jgi:hypothetical protein